MYEVYVTDKNIVDFLSDEDFIQYVFDRIKVNKFYDDKQRDKAALLTTTDLRTLFENPQNMKGQSMYMLPGFPSMYSRYFSKYPGRDPSAEIYSMLAEIDIQYLEDIS